MADIIRQGTRPEDEVMIGTCEVCSTVFKCLQGDCKNGTNGMGLVPKPCKHAVCPHCGHSQVRVKRKKDVDLTANLIIAFVIFIVFPLIIVWSWIIL